MNQQRFRLYSLTLTLSITSSVGILTGCSLSLKSEDHSRESHPVVNNPSTSSEPLAFCEDFVDKEYIERQKPEPVVLINETELLADVDLDGGGRLGATAGGIQDITFARGVVDEGKIPFTESFVIEGILSEHDLPLELSACAETLCLGAGAGIGIDNSGNEKGYIQVGLSSNIIVSEFERPSLSLIAVVDVSGSMGFQTNPQSRYDSAGEISRDLLKGIASELNAQDDFTLVTYGDEVLEVLGQTNGAAQDAIQRSIRNLQSAGSTNMEAGLELAFQLARQNQSQAEESRILLFTDVQPNVGADTPSEFEEMVAAAAEDNISTTVFGTGIGMGVETFKAMAHHRGGNAFSVTSLNIIDEFLGDNFPYMFSPIAYDLNIEIQPAEGQTIANAFGFPGHYAQCTGFEVKSVFLSKNRGALLIEVDDIAQSKLTAELNLSYEDQEGVTIAQNIVVEHSEPNFDKFSVERAAALALLVDGMAKATALYAENPEEAAQLMRDALERFSSVIDTLHEADTLRDELPFAQKLLELIESGAEQGNFYGGA